MKIKNATIDLFFSAYGISNYSYFPLLFILITFIDIVFLEILGIGLFELIVEKFASEREKYNYYISNLEELDALLLQGAEKASKVANKNLLEIQKSIGIR